MKCKERKQVINLQRVIMLNSFSENDFYRLSLPTVDLHVH